MKNKRGRIVSKKKHFSEKVQKLKGFKPFTKSNNPQEELDAQHQKARKSRSRYTERLND
jgi:hypothetical protein